MTFYGIFNLYCDESRIENTDSQFMVIGALEIPRKEKKYITNELKEIYKSYQFIHELKWTKVNRKFIPFYEKLIDYFLSNPFICFRCIVVNKKQVDLKKFHQEDEELAFFKFYYLLLKEKIHSNHEYYIFLDKKPTRDKNRIRALHSYLESFILWNRKKCNIRSFHAIESKDNLLIQFVDYLVGLMGFACNENISPDRPKSHVVNYLQKKLGRENLCSTTSLYERKFNIFVWKENK